MRQLMRQLTVLLLLAGVMMVFPSKAWAAADDTLHLKLTGQHVKADATVTSLDPNGTYTVSVDIFQGATVVFSRTVTLDSANPTYEEKASGEDFDLEFSGGEIDLRLKENADNSLAYDVSLTVTQGRATVTAGSGTVDPNNRKVAIALP